MHLSRQSGILEDVKEDEIRLTDFGDTRMAPFRLEYLNPKSKSAKIDLALLENLKFVNSVRRIRGGVNYIIENYETLNLEINKILEEINKEQRIEPK